MPRMPGKFVLWSTLAATVLTIVLRYTGVNPVVVFGTSCLAILGLASILGHATEELGAHTGPRIGGILNAISLMWLNVGAGITGLVATIIVVPVVTFLAIILLRFIIEAVVALIAIAENTERTAEHTKH